MARVFISHASADATLAVEVHGWLVKDGHEVFLDRDLRDGIVVGDEWEQRLYERLRWADAVICVVTSAYRASLWCTAELVTARNRGSRLLPVWAEPGVHHPLLEALQRAKTGENRALAREELAEALRRVDAAGGSSWPDDRSPFPGLRPLDTDLQRVYFGRSREVANAATLLRSPGERVENAALMVVGPSGSGKSSFVRAGLLPSLAVEPGWLTVPAIVPGTQPVAMLARELAGVARDRGLHWSVGDVRSRLDTEGLTALVDELLLAGPGARRTRLLLVVDQFEELLNHTAAAERACFAALLGAALEGPVQVVGTIRPEFLEQLLADPDLSTLSTRFFTLRPLGREALRAVIEGPARLAGIDIDGDLTAQLVTDTDSGDALPLLAYTLAQLADGVRRGGRLLPSRYEQLGGVQGALARQAELALADATAASGRDRTEVVRDLLRLVTVDEQGRPSRLRIRRAELPHTVATQFDAFITRRLLTTDIEQGQVVIGVAHEAFLSAWEPLANAITAASTALRARRQVEQAAADWTEHGRPPGRLWERGLLAAALADTGARIEMNDQLALSDDNGETFAPTRSKTPGRRHRSCMRQRVVVADRVQLSRPACEFLRASIHRDWLRRGRSTAILSTLLVLAVLAAGVAFVQQRTAADGQRLAISRQLLAQADTALRQGDSRMALRLGEAASRIHSDPETEAGLVSTVLSTHYSSSLEGHADGVLAEAFSPDGHTLATASADQTVRLWNVSDPAHPRPLGDPLTGHTDEVNAVAFSPDGHTLVLNDVPYEDGVGL